jgi:LmbE family N-acetylglucosaminyl deacetylase
VERDEVRGSGASDGLTGHEDHQAVCTWTTKALRQAGSKAALFHKVEAEELYEQYLVPIDRAVNFYFKTDTPPLRQADACDIRFELPPSVLERKFSALAAMPTQTGPLLDRFPREFLQKAFGVEAFVRADY